MASRSLWVLALAFLVCAGTTAMVATQPTYAGLAEARTLQNAIPAQLYTISGTVRDSGGNPIADAQVIGFPDTPGQNLSINNTAVDGTYILNVIAGRYHIQASKQGFYAGHVFGVSVPPGQTGVDMSLSLLAAPATATPSGLMRVEGYLPLLKKESAAGAPDITTTPTSAAIATATPSPTPTISPTPSQTPTRTPTTTPALQPRDGHWSGTTSRNKPVSFDVSNGATSWQNFILRVSGSAGNCSSFTYEVTFDGPGPISNNQFSFQNFQSTLFITGQFTSQTAANGTYRFANYFIPGVCSGFFSQSGTWTARHQ